MAAVRLPSVLPPHGGGGSAFRKAPGSYTDICGHSPGRSSRFVGEGRTEGRLGGGRQSREEGLGVRVRTVVAAEVEIAARGGGWVADRGQATWWMGLVQGAKCEGERCGGGAQAPMGQILLNPHQWGLKKT